MTREKLLEIMCNTLMPECADRILAAIEDEKAGEIGCGDFDGEILHLADWRYKNIMRAKVPGKLVFRPTNKGDK